MGVDVHCRAVVGFPIGKSFFFNKEKTGTSKCNSKDCGKESANLSSKFCDECGSPIAEGIVLVPTEAMLIISENYFNEDYTYDDIIEQLYNTYDLGHNEFGVFSQNDSGFNSSDGEFIGYKIFETGSHRNGGKSWTSFSEIEAAFEAATVLRDKLGLDSKVYMQASLHSW